MQIQNTVQEPAVPEGHLHVASLADLVTMLLLVILSEWVKKKPLDMLRGSGAPVVSGFSDS